jgi:hypothetical protein
MKFKFHLADVGVCNPKKTVIIESKSLKEAQRQIYDMYPNRDVSKWWHGIDVKVLANCSKLA